MARHDSTASAPRGILCVWCKQPIIGWNTAAHDKCASVAAAPVTAAAAATIVVSEPLPRADGGCRWCTEPYLRVVASHQHCEKIWHAQKARDPATVLIPGPTTRLNAYPTLHGDVVTALSSSGGWTNESDSIGLRSAPSYSHAPVGPAGSVGITAPSFRGVGSDPAFNPWLRAPTVWQMAAPAHRSADYSFPSDSPAARSELFYDNVDDRDAKCTICKRSYLGNRHDSCDLQPSRLDEWFGRLSRLESKRCLRQPWVLIGGTSPGPSERIDTVRINLPMTMKSWAWNSPEGKIEALKHIETELDRSHSALYPDILMKVNRIKFTPISAPPYIVADVSIVRPIPTHWLSAGLVDHRSAAAAVTFRSGDDDSRKNTMMFHPTNGRNLFQVLPSPSATAAAAATVRLTASVRQVLKDEIAKGVDQATVCAEYGITPADLE